MQCTTRLTNVYVGMKTVGNGRENVLTIPAPVFFGREREREREGRTGKRIRYYGISGTEYSNGNVSITIGKR